MYGAKRVTNLPPTFVVLKDRDTRRGRITGRTEVGTRECNKCKEKNQDRFDRDIISASSIRLEQTPTPHPPPRTFLRNHSFSLSLFLFLINFGLVEYFPRVLTRTAIYLKNYFWWCGVSVNNDDLKMDKKACHPELPIEK